MPPHTILETVDAQARAAMRHAKRFRSTGYDARAEASRLSAALGRACMAAVPGNDRAHLSWLRQALRKERRRGHAGHWSYDINRHLALSQALAAELARLKSKAAAVRTLPPP